MPTFRVQKNKDYTIVNNAHIRDKRLSLKTKGLLELMLALPDEWDYSVKGLVALCNEKQSAIETALKELKDYGYLMVEKQYPNETATGRIEYVYTVFERPQPPKQEAEKQGVEIQGVEFQGVENHPQLNTNITNTNLSNTDKRKSRKEKEDKFVPPTIEEVRTYCRERNKGVDPEKWMDHYIANGWKVGKVPMIDWKASVRTWEKEDFKQKQPDKKEEKHFSAERTYDDNFFKNLENRDRG